MLDGLQQERSQHWDERRSHSVLNAAERGHTVVPLQLNYPVHNGEAPRTDTSIESVSAAFVKSHNFHLCRNRFAPKGKQQ